MKNKQTANTGDPLPHPVSTTADPGAKASPPPSDPALDPAPAYETCDQIGAAPTTYEAYKALNIDALAHAFALAVLRNPNVAQLLYGDPLQPHRCGDHPSVGAYLAHACRRLATDYYREREALAFDGEFEMEARP